MNLTDLHRAIESTLRAALPGVDVASYPDLAGRVSLPLVVLELSEFEPGTDPGTGELALEAIMQARLVMDPNQTDAELYCRQLAARLAVAVHQARSFCQPVTPARIRQLGPDGFRADLDGYLVWLIEWQHELHIGDPLDLAMPPVRREFVLFAEDEEAVRVPL